MTSPLISDPDFTLYVGDALNIMSELPAASVQCVATSPPYWGLRDYGVEGQLGVEDTPDEYVAALVAIMSEARRVLRDDGTLWLNLGDSYAGGGGYSPGSPSNVARQEARSVGDDFDGSFRVMGERNYEARRKRAPGSLGGLKPKDLAGIPWRVALALQADGWYLRSDIIWHKPNPMPEKVTDRPTRSHEYLFLLAKQSRYHFDAEAIAEPAAWDRWGDQTVPKHEGTPTAAGWIKPKTKAELQENTTRNARSVWTITTTSYPGAHFATWPEALVERILNAACPPGEICLDPFIGSGTTALACRHLGRRCIGIELNPEYAEMAAKRLQQLSLLAE